MRHSTQHHIYLPRLEHNFKQLRELCGQNELLFMVKANAYGHGIFDITRFSHEHCGVKEFGFATLGEALQLQQLPKKIQAEFYIFSELGLARPEAKTLFADNAFVPVLSTESQLDIFLNDKELSSLPLCLKYNTGMNRLGLDCSLVEDHIRKIKSNGRGSVYHLMSHFSSSGQSVYKLKKSEKQYQEFQNVKETIRAAGIDIEKTSVSNSGAIEQSFGLEESHVRPGLMLYGPSGLIPELRQKYQWKGKSISNLTAEILRVFDAKKGDPIGYGASPLPDSGKVAILSIGYGDGWSTAMNSCYLNSNDIKGRFVGRVNMDMSQVLLDESSNNLKEGDVVTLWDENISTIYDLSDKSGLLTYELFTNLSTRIPKVHYYE